MTTSDTAISRTLGVPQGRGRNQLQGFDVAVTGRPGTAGARFRRLATEVGREFTLHPALIASNAVAETLPHHYLMTTPVSNALVGLDYWDEQRHRVRRRLGRVVPTTLLRDSSDPNCSYQVVGVCHFVNERGKDTGPMHQFRDGRDALRAMGAWLRLLELRLIDEVRGPEAWMRIPEPLRMALIRLSYNPGRQRPRPLARRTLGLVDAARDPRPLFRTSSGRPLQATIRAAQAWHLANHGLGPRITWNAVTREHAG